MPWAGEEGLQETEARCKQALMPGQEVPARAVVGPRQGYLQLTPPGIQKGLPEVVSSTGRGWDVGREGEAFSLRVRGCRRVEIQETLLGLGNSKNCGKVEGEAQVRGW